MGLPKYANTDGLPGSKSVMGHGSGMRIARPSVQQISVALETLANLVYLIDAHAQSWEHVRTFTAMAEEPLKVLHKSLEPIEPATSAD